VFNVTYGMKTGGNIFGAEDVAVAACPNRHRCVPRDTLELSMYKALAWVKKSLVVRHNILSSTK